jgi:hypothetical protein
VRIEGQTGYVTVACKKRAFLGEAIVDAIDLEWVRRYRWYAKWDAKSGAYYVWTGMRYRDGEGKQQTMTESLHRMVMQASARLNVDHQNHNTLDNRRANLRVVTHAQNMQNLKGARKGSSSGVRGVSWDAAYGKWKVGLKVNGRQIYLGRYDSLEDAEAVAIMGRQTYMTHSLECEASALSSSRTSRETLSVSSSR